MEPISAGSSGAEERSAQISQLSQQRAISGDPNLSVQTLEAIRNGATPPLVTRVNGAEETANTNVTQQQQTGQVANRQLSATVDFGEATEVTLSEQAQAALQQQSIAAQFNETTQAQVTEAAVAEEVTIEETFAADVEEDAFSGFDTGDEEAFVFTTGRFTETTEQAQQSRETAERINDTAQVRNSRVGGLGGDDGAGTAQTTLGAADAPQGQATGNNSVQELSVAQEAIQERQQTLRSQENAGGGQVPESERINLLV